MLLFFFFFILYLFCDCKLQLLFLFIWILYFEVGSENLLLFVHFLLFIYLKFWWVCSLHLLGHMNHVLLGLLEVTCLHRQKPECVPNWTSTGCFAALLKKSSLKGPCNTHTSVETVGDCLEEAVIWEFENLCIMKWFFFLKKNMEHFMNLHVILAQGWWIKWPHHKHVIFLQ